MRRAFSRKARGHPPPRPAQHLLQDNPAGRVRVATPHGLPVLVCTRVRGQLQKPVYVSAHLAVVANGEWHTTDTQINYFLRAVYGS